MAETPRKSGRVVKPRLDPEFAYDPTSVNFLQRRENRVSHQPQATATDNITTVNTGKKSNTSDFWSDTNFPLFGDYYNIENQHLSRSQEVPPVTSTLPNTLSSVQKEEVEFVVDVNIDAVRRNSSTRIDYLDTVPYLSASTGEHTNTSDMDSDGHNVNSGDEALNQGLQAQSLPTGGIQGCVPNKLDTSGDFTLQALLEAVAKIDILTTKMKSLETLVVNQNAAIGNQHLIIGRQNSRISQLEQIKVASSSQESEHESVKSKRSSQKSSQESGHESHQCQCKSKSKSSHKSKGNIVEEEKARSYTVVKGKLSDPCISESDGDVNSKGLKKKMSKKQRDLCSSRVSATLRKTKSDFPSDDCDSTADSGKESCDGKSGCTHSSKVKSGAKIKRRPVVRTELWPHTLANEEDGVELDSENIGLSKFYEHFSAIIATCESKSESRGRAALLKSISTVVGCLQWPDARAFHNLVLLKIEQGKVDWDEDFTAIADTFIEKKVRATLRARQAATGSGASRANGYGRGAGYSSRNQGQRNNFQGNPSHGSGRGKPIYGAICWQWNTGTCSYGANCKRWHCCKTCAEAGKLGEQHRSASHEGQGPSPAQPAQRS